MRVYTLCAREMSEAYFCNQNGKAYICIYIYVCLLTTRVQDQPRCTPFSEDHPLLFTHMTPEHEAEKGCLQVKTFMKELLKKEKRRVQFFGSREAAAKSKACG